MTKINYNVHELAGKQDSGWDVATEYNTEKELGYLQACSPSASSVPTRGPRSKVCNILSSSVPQGLSADYCTTRESPAAFGSDGPSNSLKIIYSS